MEIMIDKVNYIVNRYWDEAEDVEIFRADDPYEIAIDENSDEWKKVFRKYRFLENIQ